MLNDSKVVPARLKATKWNTGGALEILLLEEIAVNEWWAIVQPGKRFRSGVRTNIHDRIGRPTEVTAALLEKNQDGRCRLRFEGTPNISDALGELGDVPLPPYIHRPSRVTSEADWMRYQTVYARAPGSVAAPTAGLHFSENLLRQIREHGVAIHEVTLHVGLGTFAPVKTDELTEHVMHEESFELSQRTADAINAAKASGRRVFAVGTTTVRVLESVAAMNDGQLTGTAGRTRIFLYPPCSFRIVDALVTNFHVPRSTLLMLVSAFAAPGETRGRELVLRAYAEAIDRQYRFFSYGDAMLIL